MPNRSFSCIKRIQVFHWTTSLTTPSFGSSSVVRDKTSHCRSSQGHNPVISSFWMCHSPGMGLTIQKSKSRRPDLCAQAGYAAMGYILHPQWVSVPPSPYLNSVLDSLTWDSQPENSSMARFWIMLLYRCSFSCQISCRIELLHLGKPFPLKSHCIWYGWDFRNADLRIR